MRRSPWMRALRALTVAAALVLLLPLSAVAQVSVDPTVTPEINTGGWVLGMAILLAVIGVIVLLLVVAAYVRFAPRFSTDESNLKVVRADRVRPGEELPRRTVDLAAAAPVVVAPPPLPQPASVAAPAAPAPSAPAAAPPSAAPEGQGATPTTAPPSPGGPGSESPSTEAPQARPGSEAAPAEADAATERRETPDAAVSEPAPAPTPAPAEHADVSMDQQVFEQKLQELLAQGTDKRVAEGQARRAALIAARKKAAGGA